MRNKKRRRLRDRDRLTRGEIRSLVSSRLQDDGTANLGSRTIEHDRGTRQEDRYTRRRKCSRSPRLLLRALFLKRAALDVSHGIHVEANPPPCATRGAEINSRLRLRRKFSRCNVEVDAFTGFRPAQGRADRELCSEGSIHRVGVNVRPILRGDNRTIATPDGELLVCHLGPGMYMRISHGMLMYSPRADSQRSRRFPNYGSRSGLEGYIDGVNDSVRG